MIDVNYSLTGSLQIEDSYLIDPEDILEYGFFSECETLEELKEEIKEDILSDYFGNAMDYIDVESFDIELPEEVIEAWKKVRAEED